MNLKFGYLFVVLLLLQTLMPQVADSKPIKKRVIGGMALSGLAGMAIGHAMANRAQQQQQQQEQQSAVLPNGCYKQTVREPDLQDPQKYIETERLVCPPGVTFNSDPTINLQVPAAVPAPAPVNPVQYVQQQLPQQPIFGQPEAQPPQPIQPAQPAAQPQAVYPAVLPVQQPVQPMPMQPVQPVQPVHNIQPAQPVHPIQHIQSVQPVQPVQPVQAVQPVQGSPQVIVLSKKTGYIGKSSADTTIKTNILLILTMIFLLKWFH